MQYTVPLSCIAMLVALYFALRPALPRLWRGLMLFACAATSCTAQRPSTLLCPTSLHLYKSSKRARPSTGSMSTRLPTAWCCLQTIPTTYSKKSRPIHNATCTTRNGSFRVCRKSASSTTFLYVCGCKESQAPMPKIIFST